MSLMGSVLIIIQIILTVSAKDCNRNKSKCCYNEYFDANTGKCRVCMNGSIGWNCETPCMSGYYGYLCSTPCECEAHMCDKQTGCQPRQEEKYSSVAPNSNGIDLTLNISHNGRSINSEQDSTRYHFLIMVTFGFVVFILTVVIPANVLYLRWTIKRDIKLATKNSSERNDTIRQNYCTLRHLTSSHQDLINNDALNSPYDELHCSYM